jgi:hypothetical protein
MSYLFREVYTGYNEENLYQRSRSMLYATVIHEKNLEMIAVKNGGVQPSLEPGINWFVWNTDPDGFNEILNTSDFYEKYRTPLDILPRYTRWTEVHTR